MNFLLLFGRQSFSNWSTATHTSNVMQSARGVGSSITPVSIKLLNLFKAISWPWGCPFLLQLLMAGFCLRSIPCALLLTPQFQPCCPSLCYHDGTECLPWAHTQVGLLSAVKCSGGKIHVGAAPGGERCTRGPNSEALLWSKNQNNLHQGELLDWNWMAKPISLQWLLFIRFFSAAQRSHLLHDRHPIELQKAETTNTRSWNGQDVRHHKMLKAPTVFNKAILIYNFFLKDGRSWLFLGYIKKKKKKEKNLKVFLSNIFIPFPEEIVGFITADASSWAVQEKSHDFPFISQRRLTGASTEDRRCCHSTTGTQCLQLYVVLIMSNFLWHPSGY